MILRSLDIYNFTKSRRSLCAAITYGEGSPHNACAFTSIPCHYRVTESKNKDYAVGDLVVGDFGWRTHTISDGTPGIMFPVRKIDPSITLSLSTSLGILGMPGLVSVCLSVGDLQEIPDHYTLHH